MNLFVTSTCPMACAQVLDDKRVVKMCLEAAQLACTAVNELGGTSPYKTTHKNHPCSIWARQSLQNFRWVCLHGVCLGVEYHERYGKRHKCERILIDLFMQTPEDLFPSIERTPFVNCAANKSLGIDYKDMEDTYMAYQLYLNDRWDTDKRAPKWFGTARM